MVGTGQYMPAIRPELPIAYMHMRIKTEIQLTVQYACTFQRANSNKKYARRFCAKQNFSDEGMCVPLEMSIALELTHT